MPGSSDVLHLQELCQLSTPIGSHLKEIEQLLKKPTLIQEIIEAPLNVKTPLHLLAQKGDIVLVERFLSALKTYHSDAPHCVLNKTGEDEYTPFMEAVFCQQFAVADLLWHSSDTIIANPMMLVGGDFLIELIFYKKEASIEYLLTVLRPTAKYLSMKVLVPILNKLMSYAEFARYNGLSDKIISMLNAKQAVSAAAVSQTDRVRFFVGLGYAGSTLHQAEKCLVSESDSAALVKPADFAIEEGAAPLPKGEGDLEEDLTGVFSAWV